MPELAYAVISSDSIIELNVLGVHKIHTKNKAKINDRFRIGSNTKTITMKTPLGSGPRHFTFHPNGNYAYCIEELSGVVAADNYHDGKLDTLQRVFSYSKIQKDYGSSDIHISPDGLFLYASNRWEDEN